MLNIELYRPIMEFLALYLGKDSEIILSDTEKIRLIQNPSHKGHYEGAPLGEMLQAMIHNPECSTMPFNVNYRTLSQSGEKMRSATMFIREEQLLTGLLTINTNVSELIKVRSALDFLINGGQSEHSRRTNAEHKPKDSFETLSLSVTGIIGSVLEEAAIRFNAPYNRLTASEKLSVIREMDSRGVFLAKGSVNEVADRLGASKATIYRYLHQLQNSNSDKTIE